MSIPTAYSFQRYLSAKKSVDDRALNRPVIQQLTRAMEARSEAEPPLRILEIGAGIGTMIERLLEWDALPERVIYTAVDLEQENINAGMERLPKWAAAHQASCTPSGPRSYHVELEGHALTVEWEVADIFSYAAETTDRTWDVLIGQAFLDLVNVPDRLPTLFEVLEPGGIFYFPITFDGATLFEPTINPVFDEHIEQCYHDTMDQRVINGEPSGDSRTGRHLFAHVQEAGGEVLAAGSSDWVVFARQDGYPFDEGYFLHHILEMVENALKHNPSVDNEELSAWITQRHHQVKQGTLVYIAHQLDLLGKLPTTG